MAQTNTLGGAPTPAGGNGEEIRFRGNGTPSLIRVGARQMRRAAAIKPDEATRDGRVRDFFQSHRSLLRITNPDAEFEIRQREADAKGDFHYRLQQRYHGIKVWGGEASVHLAADGSVDSMEGAFIPTPGNISTNAAVTLVNAFAVVNQRYFAGRGQPFGKSELVINGTVNGVPRLVWKFSMASNLVDARRFLMDAISAEVVSVVTLVEHGAVVGSGTDTLGYTQSLNLWQSSSIYYLVDTSKAMYAVTSAPPTFSACKGTITMGDFGHSQDWSVADYVKSSYANSGWLPDAVSGATELSKVYDYYLSRFGRNSYDNKGNSLLGVVRYGSGYANAFWTEQYQAMAYGDGYASALDICGHEVTHGVIYSIGDVGILDYHDQSGALNEALADIFGECIEARTIGANDWLIGSQLAAPIRNIANPHALLVAGRPYPATMGEFIQPTDPFLNNFQNQDSGGVHLNSTIIGHCFYLLTQGINGAIGMSDAEKIFYRAMTLHLLLQSQFIDMRHACVTSAEELFGVASAQALKTAEAFDAVEIFDAPPTAPPGTIPAVQAPDSTLCLRLDTVQGNYYLVRKESALGDASGGHTMDAAWYLSSERVSVSGDGSSAAFVGADNDIGLIATDGSTIDFANSPGAYHSVAISPDASRVAVVLRNQSTGLPENTINIIDINSSVSTPFALYGVTSEGSYIDVVDHADVMDFTADGRYLVYDAYCYSVTASGDILDGWTIFAMDTTTGAIQTLLDVNTDYDFGNPALGNTHGNLIALDVTDKATGYSTVISGNLATGASGVVGTTYGLGVPGYTGDDSAVIFSLYDTTVASSFSLARQALAADGTTPTGSATWWLRDADYSAIYRRGTFYPYNNAPQATLALPLVGQVFASPTNIVLQANATDADGTVGKVEFYADSAKLGTDTTAPYSMTWTNPPVGSHRVTARAIDNLGNAGDSANVLVYVLVPPKLTAQPPGKVVPVGSNLTFSAAATGTAPLFYQWWKDGAALLGETNWSYNLPSVQTNDAGAYSVTVSNLVRSVSSTNAILTVYVPPFITVQPSNQTVWAGSNVTFTLAASGVPAVKYQWRKNATNLNGATNANFTTNNVTALAAGTYSCVVSNAFASAISSNAVLTVLIPDTTNPTNLIIAPTAGQRWSDSVFNVTGTAGDNALVSNVWYQINGLGWHPATTGNNWTNWTTQVMLTPGTNTLTAYSVDTSGNFSLTNRVSFQYVVTNQLQVFASGLGTIAPNYSNAWLEIGRNYSMTSAPASGFRFTNWTGSLTTSAVTLNFTMASNLTFVASFIDTNRPVLSLTNVLAGQRWSNAVFTVRGTAGDNWQIGNVWYQLNGLDWSNAITGNAWTNWSAALNLVPGTNSIRTYAVDNTGNLSLTNSLSFDFVVTNQLQLRLSGKGTAAPNYSNAWLEIGRNYSLTSAPASGFVFTNWAISTNWLGGALVTGTNLQFMMQSNLTLQANFLDVAKPTLTITAPTNGQKMPNALAIVTGTAADNWQISNVWYQLNGGVWSMGSTSNGYTNWTTTTTLVVGTNSLKAFALDLGGNVSTTNSVSFVSSNTFKLQMNFALTQPLTATGLNFSLQISPGLNGHIQVSTNLATWTALTNFVGTNTTLNFRDSASANSRQRFYRAVIP